MTPSLRQLEYFVAVAEHMSFGRAADACHVTQPGLSAQIQQLEHLLDVCDRVGVLFRGRLMDTMDAADATPERIGLLMAGVAA